MAFGPCEGEVLPTQCAGGDSSCTCGGGSDAGADTATACASGVAAPRLLAPLSTARTTQRKPQLKWALGAGSDGAHIELCKDRACGTVLATIDATGTSAAPSNDLPAGVLYWRAFGTSGGHSGCAASATWELVAPPRSAPVDTSWGSMLDVNEDGFPDAVVGGSGAFFWSDPVNTGQTEQVSVFLGNGTGLPQTPAATLTGKRGFGRAVADAGDVNGDGYADVLVATWETATQLFLGGPGGLASTPAVTLPVGDQAPGTGGGGGSAIYMLAGVGDTNGDGYADVAVGASDDTVYLFTGSQAGLMTTPAATIHGSSVGLAAGSSFGVTLSSAGDVNGDGYGDLIVGASPSGNPASLELRKAYVFHGSASGLAIAPATTPTVPQGSATWGLLVMGGGDVNGDGYADVLVQGAPAGASGDTSSTYVFYGGAGGVSATPDKGLLLAASSTTWYGVGKTSVDLNGDGYSDVVVGAEWTGEAYVFMGSPQGPETTPSRTIPGGTPGYFAGSLSGADLNGDGFGDLAVANGNGLFVYAGSANGVGTTATSQPSTGGGFSAFHVALGSP
jgi:hypothetical protein